MSQTATETVPPVPVRLALRGTVVSDGVNLPDGVVLFSDDRIDYVGAWDEFITATDPASYWLEQLPEGAHLLPGLVDLHCHGGFGADFTTSSTEELTSALSQIHATGTTTLLASLMSAPAELLVAACERLAALAQEGLIAGIHSEGPFLSEVRCGAQPTQYLRSHDPALVDAMVEAAQGQLRTMTYAPEREGSDALVEQLVSHGVVPSVGHTDADAQTTADSLRLVAEELGSAGFDGFTEVPTVTHCFNGMAPWHHRVPGAAGAALDIAGQGGAVLEAIGDGHHLADETLRLMFRGLPQGAVILVSDAMSASGLPDGTYQLGDKAITVEAGIARTSSGALAASAATLLHGLRNVVSLGIPLEHALPAATSVPASLVGLADEVGRLHQGFRADVLVTDSELQPLAVYRGGKRL